MKIYSITQIMEAQPSTTC